jgi:hypothetical protein
MEPRVVSEIKGGVKGMRIDQESPCTANEEEGV